MCNFCYLVQEYDEQGRVETDKALNELREFIRKNDKDVWEIIGRLKDANRLDICNYTHIIVIPPGQRLRHGKWARFGSQWSLFPQ